MPMWPMRWFFRKRKISKKEALNRLEYLAKDLEILIEFALRRKRMTGREATVYNDILRLRGSILGYLAEQEANKNE